MNCPRCGGLLIDEYMVDPLEGSLSGFHGWRCVNCGAINDDVIRANRMMSLSHKILLPYHRRFVFHSA